MTDTAPSPARYRRILMTGGTGFVGGHLCPRLVEAFPQAKRLMLTRSGDCVTRDGFVNHAIDLTDHASVDAVFAQFRPDLVLHLAAQAAITAASAAKQDTWRLNVEGTLHLAGAIARHVPTTTFLFVSSAEVYGLAFRDGPATEETVPRPMNAYARSKYAAEMALADVLPEEASLVVARAFNHTGPGQDTRFALPAFAAQIAAIEAGNSPPRLMVGNLEAQRDFLDVRDVCDAYLALVRWAPPRCRETVNVASGKAHRMRDLLDELCAQSSATFEVLNDPARMRPSEIDCSVGRPDRIMQATGWRPNIPISETLRDVLQAQRDLARGTLAS